MRFLDLSRWFRFLRYTELMAALTPSRPRAIVSLSGGMDSCVCAALAARDYEACAIHFSYGQRTEARELQSARAVAEALGIARFLHLRLDLFRAIGGSALTDASIPVPEAPALPEAPRAGAAKAHTAGSAAAHGDAPGGETSAPLRGAEIPVTYVPFRNAHFLSAAVSWAETINATHIYIGAVEQDSSGYPDCRPAYYDAFRELIRQGTREGNIQIVTPLIHLRKQEIVRLGVELGAPLHVTWSCYQGEAAACGVCDSCVLRLRAFAGAGVHDSIPYATRERDASL